MELGLSIGNTPSNIFHGVTKTSKLATATDDPTNDHQHQNTPQHLQQTHKENPNPQGNETFEMEIRASINEDKNGIYKKKMRVSKRQSAYLEETYKYHSNPNPKQKLELAKQLNLSLRQVEVWFQNRRARTKLKQTEVDCEYLKKCCETLTLENKRLQKELQELMVSKTTSNPFYAATTHTICPSCECAAANGPPLPTTPYTNEPERRS